MSAVPGLPPAWPRRRRVAGFARGSASGGAVAIPVHARKRAELRALVCERLQRLPGVTLHTAAEATDPPAYVALDASLCADPPDAMLESGQLAQISAAGDFMLRLPAAAHAAVVRAGWAREDGGRLRVFPARNRGEAEIIWRIILCAYEFAAGTAADATSRRERATAYRLVSTACPPVEIGAAI